jgi:flagellar export protein FliJ
MSRALATLLRVREIRKKQARNAFGEAERARIAQDGQVLAIESAIDDSRNRGGEAIEDGTAHWVALEHGFRLRKEVELRQARDSLEQLSEAATARRMDLQEASRKSRVVEAALERYDEQVALDRRRADGRRIDAMATMRWWRENT